MPVTACLLVMPEEFLATFHRLPPLIAPAGFLPMPAMAVCAACEVIIGLAIEMSCLATFTQRYFGK